MRENLLIPMTKYCVVCLILIAKACLAGIIIETLKKHESADLVEATVQVLTSCYKNRIRSVGIAGNTPEILLRSLWAQKSFTVVITNNASRKVEDDSIYSEFEYKLQLFVISASSASELRQIIGGINDSPWWNHMAFYFIVDWSTSSKTGCANVSKLLWTAWQMDLLNAKAMCLHYTKGQLIYSYNPYTSQAPNHWHLEDTFRGNDDHPWTLFVREYRKIDEEICRDLDFEKTTDLGGYKIRSTVKDLPLYWHTDDNKTGIDSFTEKDGLIAQDIFRVLNATTNLRTHKSTSGRGHSSGDIEDIMVELIDGNSDIVLNPRRQFDRKNVAMTYPRSYIRMFIVTQSKGIESQLTKILSIFDNYSRLALLLVVSITLMTFKLLLRQTLMTALLNLLRIVLNSSLVTIPKNLPMRIYLASLFSLNVTIIAIFQGKMASVLTMKQPVRNVDTIEDLLDLNYTVYGPEGLAFMLFSDPIVQDRYNGYTSIFCLEYVFRNPSAACISTHEYLSSLGVTLSRKLHVSKNEIMTATLVYLIRENWPLEHRFNKILRTLTESYIIQNTDMKTKNRLYEAERFYKKIAEMEKFTVITMDEMMFAFVILAIGLGCASACFIIEVAVKRLKMHHRCYI